MTSSEILSTVQENSAGRRSDDEEFPRLAYARRFIDRHQLPIRESRGTAPAAN